MKKKRYEMPDLLPDSLNREDWGDFVKSRIEIGYPLTPIGAKRIIKKLSTYSQQIQRQAMSKAIECGYRGVFPESERVQETMGFIEKHSDSSWADEMPDNVQRINKQN
tara:strand:+ start:2108 stop:2431 length:324 start_codon:yes stop_codon:yes gene_type:complete